MRELSWAEVSTAQVWDAGLAPPDHITPQRARVNGGRGPLLDGVGTWGRYLDRCRCRSEAGGRPGSGRLATCASGNPWWRGCFDGRGDRRGAGGQDGSPPSRAGGSSGSPAVCLATLTRPGRYVDATERSTTCGLRRPESRALASRCRPTMKGWGPRNAAPRSLG
jgi:hypothetical protein